MAFYDEIEAYHKNIIITRAVVARNGLCTQKVKDNGLQIIWDMFAEFMITYGKSR